MLLTSFTAQRIITAGMVAFMSTIFACRFKAAAAHLFIGMDDVIRTTATLISLHHRVVLLCPLWHCILWYYHGDMFLFFFIAVVCCWLAFCSVVEERKRDWVDTYWWLVVDRRDDVARKENGAASSSRVRLEAVNMCCTITCNSGEELHPDLQLS